MDFLDTSIFFLACMAEIYILYDYFYNFFEIKIAHQNIKLICVGTTIILFMINLLHNSLINLLVVPILLWTFVSIVFDAKPGVRIGYFVTAYIVMIAVEFLYAILSETTADTIGRFGLVQVSEYSWQLLFIKFVNYIVFLLLKQTSTKSKQRITNRLFWTYLCVPITTLGTMLAVFYSGIDVGNSIVLKYILTLFFVCMILGNMLFFYAFQKYAENLEFSHQQQIEIVQQRAEINHLTKMAKINEDFNEITHNTMHYLKVIGQLAYENKTDEISAIVETLNGKINREIVAEYSNHKMLNVILSEYDTKAQDLGIEFNVYVEPGCLLNSIQDMDLITMLGNILENAVLASSKVKENACILVRIFMQKDGKLCIIKVVNDFSGQLNKVKGRLISTKKEKGVHGIGLASVGRIAESYEGYFEYYVQEGKFNSILVLPVKKDR